jgi:chromosome segregation ATPase
MRIQHALLPLAAAMILAGCGKADTSQSVIGQAEGAVTTVRDSAQAYAPEELKSAEAKLAQMKQDHEQKNYEAVVAAVPDMNAQIKSINDAVAAKQVASVAAEQEWTTLNQEVPKAVEVIQARVDELAGSAKLPKDVTKEAVATSKTELETVKATWAAAEADASAGKLVEATEKGRTVQAKVAELKTQLQVTEEPSQALASNAAAPTAG